MGKLKTMTIIYGGMEFEVENLSEKLLFKC
jgi:hypothetical protein